MNMNVWVYLFHIFCKYLHNQIDNICTHLDIYDGINFLVYNLFYEMNAMRFYIFLKRPDLPISMMRDSVV